MNLVNNFKSKSLEDKVGIVLFILSIIFFIFVISVVLTKPALWYDELYSLSMSRLSFTDILAFTSGDVHPPLSYLLLKIPVSILTCLNIQFNIGIIGKIISFIPFILLLVLSSTKIRNRFGTLTCGIFSFCIITMPQLMNYISEIRMYGWALLFVTFSFLYAYEILKDSTLKNWIIFTIGVLASAYTHYFAAISVFCIYLMLIIYFLLKNKEELKKLFLSAFASFLVYLPWLFVLNQQIHSMKGSYWINDINLNFALGYVSFVVSPINTFIQGNETVPMGILGILLLFSIILLVYKSFKKNNVLKDYYAISGILVLVTTVLIGVTVSLLYNPIFNVRYLVPSLGCFWLGFSILLSKNFTSKKLFISIISILLIVACVGSMTFYNETDSRYNYGLYNQMIIQNEFGTNNIVIFDSPTFYLGYSGYYLENNTNLIYDEDNISDYIYHISSESNIQDKLHNGSKLFIYLEKNESYDNCIDNNIQLVYASDDSESNLFDAASAKLYEVKINK